MVKKKNEVPVGRIDYTELINKKVGRVVAHSLKDKNPTRVEEWIPTGSRWLDASICKGKLAGIPVGKITKIAGLQSTGKSYLALQIAKHAQKMGIKVFYFDSESAMDPEFAKKIGVEVEDQFTKMEYLEAYHTEFVLEQIEFLTGASEQKKLFIWDSLANTPCKKELEADFDPGLFVGLKPRILSQGFKKLIQPIANAQNTLLILNQLKTRIPRNPYEARSVMSDPWFEPGGLAPGFGASLSVRLVTRKAKSGYVVDDNDYRIGNEVKAVINKSRFGTDGRQCTFNIIWADDPIGIRDEESWFEALLPSGKLKSPSAGWYEIEGFPKFRQKQWVDLINGNSNFKKTVLEIFDEEVIKKFEERSGDGNIAYKIDGEEGENENIDVVEEV